MTLGLRRVKKTVNFDAPDVYHLYYGDEVGTPGTVMTYFPFPNIARGLPRHAARSARRSFAVSPERPPLLEGALREGGRRGTWRQTDVFGEKRLRFLRSGWRRPGAG